MDKIKIFKRLKQDYITLTELGYNVIYISLKGSQNYNLDIDNNEYKSDIDTLAVVVPSFKDFTKNTQPVSTTIVLDNNEHIDIKDIRLMFDLYIKQNPQFLESIFSEYIIINKVYNKPVTVLMKIADDITKIDHKYLYNSIVGMANQKYKALYHPYPSIIEKINKYGYDGKQLHHLLRNYIFFRNLLDGKTFRESLTLFTPEEYKLLIDYKLNKPSLEETKVLAETYLQKTLELSNQYEERTDIIDEKREEIITRLENIKIAILKQSFITELMPKDKELDIKKYSNIYITSDLHFGHRNILSLENRCEKLNIPEDDIEAHDNILIERWNSVVSNNDLVYILGDLSFRNSKETEQILKRLNGDKILIVGNHDDFINTKSFNKELFKEICNYKEINYKGKHICMMHYPIAHYNGSNKQDGIHFFGHIHSSLYSAPRHSYNVGVDVNNYVPIKLENAIELAGNNDSDCI